MTLAVCNRHDTPMAQALSGATTGSIKGSQERIHFPLKGEIPKDGTPTSAVEIFMSKQGSESFSDLQQKLKLIFLNRFIRQMIWSPKFYLRLKGLRILSVNPKGHTVRQGPDCI
jgi:hypothetical protein